MTATFISAIPLSSLTLIQSRKAEKTHTETNATMLVPHNAKNNNAAKQNYIMALTSKKDVQ